MKGIEKITNQISQLVDTYKGEQHEMMRDQYGEVINALSEMCEQDPKLDELMNQEHKSWKRCEQYMYNHAFKMKKSNCLCVSGNIVMKWIVDYFKLDDLAQIMREDELAKQKAEREKAAKEKKPTKEVVEDTEEESEEETEEIVVEPETPLPEVKAPDRRVVVSKETKKVEKKNTDDLPGQTSIFDFLGV